MIKETYFSSSEETKASVTKELKNIKEEEFTKCFRGWQGRMQKCINSSGSALKGTICNLPKNVELKFS